MNIKFTEKAFDRFCECSFETQGKTNSIGQCVESLMRWNPWDSTIVISCDIADKSFFFQELDKEGKSGMCGGIIFHGNEHGYSIHT